MAHMVNHDKHHELKMKVEHARREADKAEGSLEELMRQLQKEFGCKSIKEAKKLLARLEKEEKEKEDEFNEALEEFEEQFDGIAE